MSEQTWAYTSTHGVSCTECAKAVKTARTYATVTGSVASTYTLSYPEGDHAGTATRTETPSAFADAPPVRTHADGSQTYGPYV
jgi:hypothetical protein